jgi:hypothetical protein
MVDPVRLRRLVERLDDEVDDLQRLADLDRAAVSLPRFSRASAPMA